MASFMSFLTRRQADRTTSMFGICVFMLKPPPQLFRRNVLATSPGESKPKSCLIACEKAVRITNRPLPSVRSHPKEADGQCSLFLHELFRDAFHPQYCRW